MARPTIPKIEAVGPIPSPAIRRLPINIFGVPEKLYIMLPAHKNAKNISTIKKILYTSRSQSIIRDSNLARLKIILGPKKSKKNLLKRIRVIKFKIENKFRIFGDNEGAKN